MIRINQIKMPPEHTHEDIRKRAAKVLRVAPDKIKDLQIIKKSIDARKKPDIYIVYTVDVAVAEQDKVLSACHGKPGQVQAVTVKEYQFPSTGSQVLTNRPIIVGTGPAGLFCGYMLAKHGCWNGGRKRRHGLQMWNGSGRREYLTLTPMYSLGRAGQVPSRTAS